MSIILELFSGLLFVVLYLGFFPALYLAAFFKRKKSVWSVLGLVSVLGTLVFSNIKGWEIFLPLFILSFSLTGAIIIWGVSNNIPALKIFLYCHVPVLVGAVFLNMFSSVSDMIMNIMQTGLSTMGQMQTLREKPEFNQNWETITLITSNLFFGLWFLDFSMRMIVGAAVLYRIQAVNKIGLGIPPLHEIKFPNWPVWIVVSCLLGIIIGLNFTKTLNFVFWDSLSLLLCIFSWYFIRGCSVIAARIFQKNTKAPTPFYLKIVLILLLFWLWPYLLIIVTTIGFFDTWMRFKKRINLS